MVCWRSASCGHLNQLAGIPHGHPGAGSGGRAAPDLAVDGDLAVLDDAGLLEQLAQADGLLSDRHLDRLGGRATPTR
jgi:hypothetical protein